jgi:hypothetical protein
MQLRPRLSQEGKTEMKIPALVFLSVEIVLGQVPNPVQSKARRQTTSISRRLMFLSDGCFAYDESDQLPSTSRSFKQN